MAGDWIKFELTTLDKPEVCQLADLADIDPDAVVGKLLRVWGWFDQQTEEGNAPSVSKKLLDRLVGVTGFCDLMKSVGWMTEADGVISLPHFERHNGKTAKNRLLTAKRVANHKAANAKGNARSVSDALPKEDVDVDLKASLSGAGDSEIPDAPVADPDAPVLMTLEWEPDARLLKAYAARAGVPLEVFTPEAVLPFVLYHEPRALAQTGKQWVAALVKWVLADRARGARVVPIARAKANGPDFHSGDTRWADDLGAL